MNSSQNRDARTRIGVEVQKSLDMKAVLIFLYVLGRVCLQQNPPAYQS